MKQKACGLVVILLIILLIPCCITYILSGKDQFYMEEKDAAIHILITEDSMEKECTLDTYIMMAMEANIPLNYHLETLKAQAVIIRTYVYVIVQQKQTNTIKAEEIGLLYQSDDSVLDKKEEEQATYKANIEKAVKETNGQVILCEGKLIVPLFHEVSVGVTRSASTAIGKNISYLQAVESKADVQSENYMQIVSFKREEIIRLAKKLVPDCDLSEEAILDEILVKERKEDGYVDLVQIKEDEVSGEVFAKQYGLNSTNFYVEAYEDSIRFICKGKGHGLGLSQFGANLKALQGETYKTILAYYYTGVTIDCYE
ncbi:SpoIID/LytB domain-containing protein [Anaerosporobacter faecicola]|uniref:SpoIID/LytB domain-containing protein n=1 Tax=Anaerosporobacter faecicola TaxID=2718714 RepID=UPI00143BDF6D|nr:SpoIID/LytB domain-containing protein [Anaerosporobacter faecicola]